MADYKDLTIEQLQTLKLDIDAQIAVLAAEKAAIAAIENERMVRANAEAKVATLTTEERAALVQVIQAAGIPAEGQVGTPG